MHSKVRTFDAAAYLDNPEVIAAYLQDALEDDDPNVFLLAVADVVKAKSVTRVAEDSGLGRESLYKTIRTGARPGFATIVRLLGALGIRLAAVPAGKGGAAKKRVAKGAAKRAGNAVAGKPAHARKVAKRIVKG